MLPARHPSAGAAATASTLPGAVAPVEHDHEALSEVATLLRLAAASGARPRDAVMTVASVGVGTLAIELANSAAVLSRGATFSVALHGGCSIPGDWQRRLYRILETAELDGGPYADALDAFQRDLRLARVTELEVGAQRLAVAVQFPVVLCILPAFIVLAIIPLVLAVLGDVQI
jgi:hypothetical protein